MIQIGQMLSLLRFLSASMWEPSSPLKAYLLYPSANLLVKTASLTTKLGIKENLRVIRIDGTIKTMPLMNICMPSHSHPTRAFLVIFTSQLKPMLTRSCRQFARLDLYPTGSLSATQLLTLLFTMIRGLDLIISTIWTRDTNQLWSAPQPVLVHTISMLSTSLLEVHTMTSL